MYHIAVTEEEKLRNEVGQLRFWCGHTVKLLKEIKEYRETGDGDPEFLFSLADSLTAILEAHLNAPKDLWHTPIQSAD